MTNVTKNFLDISNAQKSILAGNATITFVSVATGARFTYKIRKNKRQQASPFFVSLLVGSDNESSYQYFGHIFDDNTTKFYHGKKARISEDATSVKSFKWVYERLMNDPKQLVGAIKIYHSGKCNKCGRKLTTPQSIERGLGPHCAGKQLDYTSTEIKRETKIACAETEKVKMLIGTKSGQGKYDMITRTFNNIEHYEKWKVKSEHNGFKVIDEEQLND